MATWPVPPHAPRSLTPIIELTTPASARSIRLPEVDHEYDYRDESPIPQRTNQLFQNKQMGDNDGDSVYSQGSTRTIVPAVRLSDRVPDSASITSPPISPPANIRRLPSPSEGLPPPPRSLTSSVRDSTPRNIPPTSPRPISELNRQQRSDHGRHRAEEGQQQGEDEWDKASVATTSSAGIAGVGAGMKSTAPGPGTRPDSLQLSRQVSCPFWKHWGKLTISSANDQKHHRGSPQLFTRHSSTYHWLRLTASHRLQLSSQTAALHRALHQPRVGPALSMSLHR